MSVNAIMANKQLGIAQENPRSQQSEGSFTNFNVMLQAVGQKKDKESFARVFEHFAPRIKSFLIKRGESAEHADELAQETMLTVWNKASNFDPNVASASTWIFTIARNRRIDAIRRNAARPEMALPEFLPIEDESPSAAENISAAQDTALVAKALEKLSPEQAELIQKSFFEGKSHSDIAKETGVALGTVKSRIRLALERLRRDLKPEDLR